MPDDLTPEETRQWGFDHGKAGLPVMPPVHHRVEYYAGHISGTLARVAERRTARTSTVKKGTS